MGLFDKLKNVLFEEEEVEIPVLTKSEPKEKESRLEKQIEARKKEITEIDKQNNIEDVSNLKNIKRDIELEFANDESNEEIVPNIEVVEEIKEEKSPFLSFDEDEFEQFNAKIHKSVSLNNTKKEENKPNDEKPKEKIEVPKRFKLSPVISPVYGILDKNYKKEDIVEKNDSEQLNANDDFDLDSVRRKAFGTLEDDIEVTLNKEDLDKVEKPILDEEKSIDDLLNESIDETLEIIVDKEEKEIKDEVINDDLIPKPSIEEIEQEIELNVSKENNDEDSDYDSVDDVLEDNSLEDIPSFEEINNKEEEKSIPNDILEKTNTLKILDEIENELNGIGNHQDDLILEDTRETDLFNLIDSMYENKEEEETEE